jgi:two-component system chemotaxis response regulator CheY
VDDSFTMRSMLKRAFSMNDIPLPRFLEAANGKEGMELLERENIDFVIVDINMPVMNGMEMIDRMREIPELVRVPVVVVSTHFNTARIQELRENGMEYIQKPFTPEELRNVIEPMLEKLEDAVD